VALVVPAGPLDAADVAALPNRRSTSVAPANLDAFIDAHRARRFDATARLATVAVDHLLRESHAPRDGTGVVFGSPFASVDGSAAFMHRVFAKGPRAASPAEFPNLVPSAVVANVSIYMELRGPTFAVADLSISAESAFASAVDLVAAGEAQRIVAGASEPRSGIGERVRSLFFPPPSRTPAESIERARPDLAVAILVESARHAAARGATVMAQVEQVVEWRTNGASAIRSIGILGDGAREVIVARASPEVDALLLDTPWRGCPRIACASLLGESDGLGGVAIAMAAARIGCAAIDEALVIGLAGASGVAVRLSRAQGA
jgi:3-oxoacyl-[acyl-carrier-protein] synthase II